MTPATLRVLVTLLDDPAGKHWGYAIQRQAGLKAGSLYPILDRLEREGWIVGEWEDQSLAVGRPPRRYYRLTGVGQTEAREALVSRGVWNLGTIS